MDPYRAPDWKRIAKRLQKELGAVRRELGDQRARGWRATRMAVLAAWLGGLVGAILIGVGAMMVALSVSRPPPLTPCYDRADVIQTSTIAASCPHPSAVMTAEPLTDGESVLITCRCPREAP